jgi:hypothetical protein
LELQSGKKVLREQISELGEDVRMLEQQILESPPGKAFLLKRKKGID